MAKFHAGKAFHFSEDGTPATTWAAFTLVPGSDPRVYEYETKKPAEVTRLRKVDGITEVDEKHSAKGAGGKGTTDTGPSGDAPNGDDAAGTGDGEDPAGA